MPTQPLAIGVQLLPQQVSWAEWRDAWLRVDALGFDSNWSFDHVHAPRGDPREDCFEGWVGMAALAALGGRARVGMLVSAVLFRNPALAVKMATTIDHVSGGRLIYGVGAGWHVSEHEGYGWGFPPPGERVSRLEEALEVTHALWDHPGQPASYDGTFYRLRDAFNNPPPVQRPHPPILVAGGGPRIVRLAARYADMYDCWPPLDDVARRHAALAAECARVGRAAGAITRSLSMDFLWEPDPRRLDDRVAEVARAQPGRDPAALRARMLAGGAEAMLAELRRVVDAGVQHVILHVPSPYDLAGLEAFAREVLPARADLRVATPAAVASDP